MYEVMHGIPENKDAEIGSDIHGHVGSKIRDYEKLHHGFSNLFGLPSTLRIKNCLEPTNIFKLTIFCAS